MAQRWSAVAFVAAGIAWLDLVPTAALVQRDVLSGAAYHGVMAVALAISAVAWWLVGRLWRREGFQARNGYWLVLAGLVVAAPGALVEAGGLLVLGILLMLVGGPTAAVALRRERLPFWALAFVCLVGFGVLCADLFVDAPLLAAALGLGAFAAGWVAFGVLLQRRPYAFSSTPT